MRITPWRCDGEAGCRVLLRILNWGPWVIAGTAVLGLMAATFVLGRVTR